MIRLIKIYTRKFITLLTYVPRNTLLYTDGLTYNNNSLIDNVIKILCIDNIVIQ